MGIFRTTESFKCPVCEATHAGDGSITRTRLRLVGRYTKALCPDCDEKSPSNEFVNPEHVLGDGDDDTDSN